MGITNLFLSSLNKNARAETNLSCSALEFPSSEYGRMNSQKPLNLVKRLRYCFNTWLIRYCKDNQWFDIMQIYF
jgi:hypothetical protein